jgi:hypothetical protein
MPTSIGKALHGILLQSNSGTGNCTLGLPAFTPMAEAVASPEPVPDN